MTNEQLEIELQNTRLILKTLITLLTHMLGNSMTRHLLETLNYKPKPKP